MSHALDEQSTRLFRIRKTVMEMLRDRDYVVAEFELSFTKEQFREKYGDEPKREDLVIQKPKRSNNAEHVRFLPFLKLLCAFWHDLAIFSFDFCDWETGSLTALSRFSPASWFSWSWQLITLRAPMLPAFCVFPRRSEGWGENHQDVCRPHEDGECAQGYPRCAAEPHALCKTMCE